MLDEELMTFEGWDLTMPAVSERSYLYYLQPIGLGTPYVENLASYAIRLADAHAVPLWALMQKILFASPRKQQSLGQLTEPIIARLVRDEIRENQEVKEHCLRLSKWLDGNYKGTANLVEVLETATLQRNLDALTMVAWKGILSSNGLIRWEQAWCPYCYQEWQETQQPIYQPLLWLLEVVYACPRHHRRLRSACHHCGKSWTQAYRQWQQGYCPTCRNWLGLNLENSNQNKMREEELQWQLWVIQEVTALLVIAPQLAERNLQVRQQTHFAKDFKSIVRHLVEPKATCNNKLSISSTPYPMTNEQVGFE